LLNTLIRGPWTRGVSASEEIDFGGNDAARIGALATRHRRIDRDYDAAQRRRSGGAPLARHPR
jgi:hypothetical protein